MKLFADTSFFIAAVNQGAKAHALALQLMRRPNQSIVTSDWIVAELGAFLSGGQNRTIFNTLLQRIRQDKHYQVIEASRTDLDAGAALFAQRSDKEWSLVDCISFNIMSNLGMTDALTTDHHFRQAGFNALLIP